MYSCTLYYVAWYQDRVQPHDVSYIITSMKRPIDYIIHMEHALHCTSYLKRMTLAKRLCIGGAPPHSSLSETESDPQSGRHPMPSRVCLLFHLQVRMDTLNPT